MAPAPSVCWSSSSGESGDGGGSGSGGKRIKLFGTWIQGPVIRDASGLEEEGNHRDLEGEQNLLELQGDVRLRGKERHPQPDGAANSTATYVFLDCQEIRDGKKVNQWTVEEHRGFLKGLAEKGKGNWNVIAREFVKTRTPTQVATHAQKYFLRQGKPGRSPSVFDVTMETRQGSAGKGVRYGRRAAQEEARFRSQLPPPLQGPALSLAPPSPATPHPRPPSPPSPPQPTRMVVKAAPLRSEGSPGIRVAPVLHFAPHPAALAAHFFPRNVVFARRAVPRTSQWPGLRFTHPFSARELQQRFSVASSSLGKDEMDGTDLGTAA